ncbi:MAG: UDP-N-acetylmuramoyl-L-alanine--D-glutamate ligase, partial [Clostridiales bacterium]|nr:UDP-N-acetylmuramoyl-L-alanine--D-glutamate ligase [Clostridiales bacterium]
NYFNIGTVYGISKELGVSDTDFLSALKTYTPPPHRLEYAGKFNEIDFYDDSISTISETCINAIKFVPNIATILIGGMDRGIDYTQLEDFLISDSIENVIFMEASGKRIYNQLDKRGQLSLRFKLVENLEEAVELAKVLTPKNKACVMSPAAASYGIFKDFEQRGEFFKKLISE